MLSYISMMTLSNGNILRAAGPLCGEFTGPDTGEFPSQRPVTRSFDVFFDLCLNKRWNKQSRRRWFEMPSPSSWHHCSLYKCCLSESIHFLCQTAGWCLHGIDPQNSCYKSLLHKSKWRKFRCVHDFHRRNEYQNLMATMWTCVMSIVISLVTLP